MIRIELPTGGKGGREKRRGVVREGVGEGEEEEEEDEMRELEERIETAQLPEHALRAAQKELKVCINLCQHALYSNRPP